MAGDCGRPRTSTEAQPFSSHYPLTLRGCHDQSGPLDLIPKRKSYQSRKRIVANTVRPALEGQDGNQRRGSKSQNSFTHGAPLSRIYLLESFGFFYCFVPTQNGAKTKGLEED